MRTRNAILGGTLSAAVLIGVPLAASAHHSHAMYNSAKVEAIKGTVKTYEFANPHVYLFLNVKGPKDKMTTYSVEMSYTENMERDGIGPRTFKAGDKVTLYVNPLRSGAKGGSYVGAIDAQGHKHGRYFKDRKTAATN